jgi:formylglycine-generating enzyme required for sulfatase activity
LIKKSEVSVAEYLEFWKSIKDPRLKKQYASYYFGHNGSLESLRAWDEDGRLLRPGLLMTHPITGISALAADAYCAYLSRKLKRQVQLPSRAQWSKAAGGIDGTEFAWGNDYRAELAVINRKWFSPVGTTQGDLSIYGVCDLSGNVREFVKVAVQGFGLKDKYAIVGGSYNSLPAVAGISHIVYSSRGGNDVGFRYVMLTEKKKVKND